MVMFKSGFGSQGPKSEGPNRRGFEMIDDAGSKRLSTLDLQTFDPSREEWQDLEIRAKTVAFGIARIFRNQMICVIR